ncbi:MAG: HAMP domain-containing protein, partial [Actinobacteria bacterium]|nr:HAMP domain-containing protein [Actinomycetota bacterium]
SLLAGAWLLRRARSSLFARLVGSFLAVLLILVIGLASASGVVFSTDLERDQLRRLDELTAGRAEQLNEAIPLELARSAEPLAGSTLAAELAAAGSSQSLDERARSITVFPGIDAVALVGTSGAVVGSWDSLAAPPARLSDADEFLVAGDALVERALAGSVASGLVSLGDGQLLAVGVSPVAPRDAAGRPQLDRLAGAIVLVRDVTDQRVVAELERRAGADTTIVVGNEAVASTLDPDVATGVAGALATGGRSRLVELSEDEVFLSAAPLVAGDGARAGTLVLTLDAAAIAGIEDTFTRSLFAVAMAGMVLAALLAAFVSSRTTRPIRRLTDAAALVAEGDLDVRVAIDRDDEVGRLADSFDEMTAALSDREAALLAAARTEADLRGRIETITASMGEALLAVDRDGAVTAANPAAAELLGRSSDDLVGRPFAELLRGEAGGTSLAAALGSPVSDRPAAARGTLGAGRRGRPVSATAAPLVGPTGATDGRVYVIRDISGEVEVERMKTEFLSNISHELRTPLTPIKGYAEVMRAKDVGRDRTIEFATNISASAQRLERIIGMLVDFAALEAGRMEVVLEPTDLGGVVDDVLGRWRRRVPDRTFGRRLSRGLPPVQVDPDLLARVFEELIDNAVKFSEDDVRILASPGEDGTVLVTVRDRGQGMEPDELDDILRDFHQVDGSATRRFGGLGLGLSIVQRILERFDADIRVGSEVGGGTDVVLVLPRADR